MQSNTANGENEDHNDLMHAGQELTGQAPLVPPLTAGGRVGQPCAWPPGHIFETTSDNKRTEVNNVSN